jgi:hypothetical protein
VGEKHNVALWKVVDVVNDGAAEGIETDAEKKE